MSPRLFGIPAARAPIVAVLRRGPSDWSHVGRWDVARGLYEPGAWIRSNLYPQRCDLSPDGRLLVATEHGRLQIRDGADAATLTWEHDLAGLVPAPAPPPEEAKRW